MPGILDGKNLENRSVPLIKLAVDVLSSNDLAAHTELTLIEGAHGGMATGVPWTAQAANQIAALPAISGTCQINDLSGSTTADRNLPNTYGYIHASDGIISPSIIGKTPILTSWGEGKPIGVSVRFAYESIVANTAFYAD